MIVLETNVVGATFILLCNAWVFTRNKSSYSLSHNKNNNKSKIFKRIKIVKVGFIPTCLDWVCS